MPGFCLSKLVERVVTSKLNGYVNSNGLENVNQSAYKHSHLTETALLSIKNEVHLSLARSEANVVMLLDQSTVFDVTDHAMLLYCLGSWSGGSGVVVD